MSVESGIYEIRNTINNKYYIGSASNLRTRRDKHFSMLRRGTHPNAHLNNASRKYGMDAFEFRVLFTCPRKDLLILEQALLDANHPEYNISPRATGIRGYKHTPEAIEKIRQAATNPSAETLQKRSDALKGNQNAAGCVRSKDYIKMISKRNKGNKSRLGQPHSQETKDKLSATRKARIASGAIKLHRLGAKQTEETKQKISDAIKEHWKTRRKKCLS